jgi:hypothetical protein
MNFCFKWRHREGSSIEFNPSGWSSNDPNKAKWLAEMNQLSSSGPAIPPVIRNWRTIPIKTILGYHHRPKYRKRKNKSAQWEVALEKPAYDLTILKLHCGKLTLKIYTKGERVPMTSRNSEPRSSSGESARHANMNRPPADSRRWSL